MIGEGGLLQALHANGYSIVDHDPDYVVVGEGRAFTFEMFEAATRMIVDGAKLIATNLDPNCPTQHGMRPGCGAIVAMLETATGLKAFSVGKPSPVMMRMARKELGLATAETTIIGDTMETDILGGVQMGYRTVLVLSGGTRREDLARYAYRPDSSSIRSPTCAASIRSRSASRSVAGGRSIVELEPALAQLGDQRGRGRVLHGVEAGGARTGHVSGDVVDEEDLAAAARRPAGRPLRKSWATACTPPARS